MRQIRFGKLIALACMGLAVACTSGTDGGTAGNTEINLSIVNPGVGDGLGPNNTSEELGFATDRVDYRITCLGNDPGTYPIPPSSTGGDYQYDDSVDISGSFEIVDTRVPPVWQAVMDLPPGSCIITLAVWDGDTIVCIGSQSMAIAEDATTKYDIVLVCSLSIDLPDGMANVDGTFDFIVGNLCPKLYVLNSIPSLVVQDSNNPNAATEVQYRSKDPDNTCGNNCDPQSCTTDNPPVCTPSPYNPLDPLCNPNLGGDPANCTSAEAGLVCIISASPSASTPINNPGDGTLLDPGHPFGGVFLNPFDEVTPVGPILAVNLNTSSPVVGLILPGLGGPVNTVSEGSLPDDPPPAGDPPFNPIFPSVALGGVDGQLPPLWYECNTSFPGLVTIAVTCSDGDMECNQNKTIPVECPGTNFCIEDQVTNFPCDSGNECTNDGVCDANCDPADLPSCNGPPVGNRCVGQGVPLADGAPCTVGGNVCLSGGCVECILDGDCANSPAPVIPGTCQQANTCASNVCVAGIPELVGAACDNGVCDGSGPPFSGATDPPCVFVAIDPPAQSLPMTVMCTNSVTADISALVWTLDVNPGLTIQGSEASVAITGTGQFDETFLDAAQAVAGALDKAALEQINATALPRTGLSDCDGSCGGGANTDASLGVVLHGDVPFTCNLYENPPGTPATCNPANDLSPPSPACDGDTCGNSDCIFSFGNPSSGDVCRRFVTIPTSSDCSVNGPCDTEDLFVGGSKLDTQCIPNGFCVTGALDVPLTNAVGSYIADNTAGARNDGAPAPFSVLMGWDDANYPTTCDSDRSLVGSPGQTCTCATPGVDPCTIGPVICTSSTAPPGFNAEACDGGAGSYALAAPGNFVPVQPPGPVGLRVNAGGLGVGLDCMFAVQGGTDTSVPADGQPDQSIPTPEVCSATNIANGTACTLGQSLLVQWPVQVP